MMVIFPMAVKILMNAATIDGIIVTNMLRNLNNSHPKSRLDYRANGFGSFRVMA